MRFWLESTDWVSILLLQRKDDADWNQEMCGGGYDKMPEVGKEFEEGVAEWKFQERAMMVGSTTK